MKVQLTAHEAGLSINELLDDVSGAQHQIQHMVPTTELFGAWSQAIVGVTLPATVFDLSSLRGGTLDLYTGQHLCVLCIDNQGDHLVSVEPKMDDGSPLESILVAPHGLVYHHSPATHMFGQAVKTIELTSFTGVTTAHLVLGTREI